MIRFSGISTGSYFILGIGFSCTLLGSLSVALGYAKFVYPIILIVVGLCYVSYGISTAAFEINEPDEDELMPFDFADGGRPPLPSLQGREPPRAMPPKMRRVRSRQGPEYTKMKVVVPDNKT